MNSTLTSIPPSDSGLTINPDSTALFATLGYFWQKIFTDIKAVQGMTAAQADSVMQGYFKLVELLNSYSCYNIPVFETRRWYPLYVYRSSLNNELLFGEGVLFGAEVSSQYYIFGSTIPTASAYTASMFVPEELLEAPFIADQIISPKHIWTNGTDYTLANGRLTFNVNPFDFGLSAQNVYNSDGSIATYTYYDSSGTPHTANDQLLILWVYNAGIDDNGLEYNLGYLFGLNVPHTSNGRDILTTVVQSYTNGCTINDIKALALASIGESPYTADSETGLPSYHDDPTAVQLFDNINTPGWWDSDLALFNGDLIPLQLPQTMLVGNYKYSIQFVNTVGTVFLNSATGAITFSAGMINGDTADINTFLQTISTTPFLTVLQTYLGAPLSTTSYMAPINLVDFMFKSFLRTTTALLRVKFTSTDQLGDFITYFDAIKSTLPPYILLMVLCDYSIPNETMVMHESLDDINTNTNASLTAVITEGVVTGVTVNTGGTGYNVVPFVYITPPITAQASVTAIISGGAVTGFTGLSGGNGYISAPYVTISPPPSGTGATVNTTISGGVVTGFTGLVGGSGYTSAPFVTIAAPQAITAQAEAIVSSGGIITSITVTNGGMGYISAPVVILNPAGTINLTGGIITSRPLSTQTGGTQIADTISMNSGGGLLIKDMTASRSLTFSSSIEDDDLRNISLTVAS